MFYARCSVFQTRVYSWPRLRPILFQPNKQSRHGENYYIFYLDNVRIIFDLWFLLLFSSFPNQINRADKVRVGKESSLKIFKRFLKQQFRSTLQNWKGEYNQLDFQFSISLLNISQVGILFQAQTSVAAPQSLMIQVCLKD